MAFRHDVLVRRWSPLHLHISPFLAPRVFTSWPPSNDRRYSNRYRPTLRTENHLQPTPFTEPLPSPDKHGDLVYPHTRHFVFGNGEYDKLSDLVWDKSRSGWHKFLKRRQVNEAQDNANRCAAKFDATSRCAATIKTSEEHGTLKSSSTQSATEVFFAIQKVIWGTTSPNYLQTDSFAWNVPENIGEELQVYYESLLEKHKRLRDHLEAHFIPEVGLKTGKPMPLISREEDDSTLWGTAFSILEFSMIKGTIPFPILNSLGKMNQTLLDWHMQITTSPDSRSARAYWLRQPPELVAAMWPASMLSALAKGPLRAMEVLYRTSGSPYIPSRAVAACIKYIVLRYFIYSRISTKDATRICTMITALLFKSRKNPHDPLVLDQGSTYLLLSNIDIRKTADFYDILDKENQPMAHKALLDIAIRLGEHGDSKMAIKILKRLKAEGFTFHDEHVSRIYTAVHRTDHQLRESEKAILPTELLQLLSNDDGKFNILHYNLQMRDACKVGKHELAWQIYDSLLTQGITPDAFTYEILMYDAKKRDDTVVVEKIWRTMQDMAFRTKRLVTDYLHRTFLNTIEERGSNKLNDGTRFAALLSIYCQHFRLEPLAHIAPVYMEAWNHLPRPVKSDHKSHVTPEQLAMQQILWGNPSSFQQNLTSPSPSLMDPSHATLTVMLSALARDLPKPPHDSKPFSERSEATKPYTVRFFEHFHKLVVARDPAVSGQLSEEPRVYNMAILCLGRSNTTLPYCTEVLRCMLTQKNVTAQESNTQLSSEQNQSCGKESQSLDRPSGMAPEPNAYTWAAVLKSFLERRQPRAAEKVLQIMAARGIMPDQIIWEVLVYGYSKNGDLEKAIDSVDFMEAAGYRPTTKTVQALQLLTDRRAVISALSPEQKARRWARKGLALEREKSRPLRMRRVDSILMRRVDSIPPPSLRRRLVIRVRRMLSQPDEPRSPKLIRRCYRRALFKSRFHKLVRYVTIFHPRRMQLIKKRFPKLFRRVRTFRSKPTRPVKGTFPKLVRHVTTFHLKPMQPIKGTFPKLVRHVTTFHLKPMQPIKKTFPKVVRHVTTFHLKPMQPIKKVFTPPGSSEEVVR
ncbi:Protein Rf1, mitochondrial [Phlyctema vagabunda]|uniref:Protein Rf1, mitochondrial n=1 Tax=Phlyctema vagabunda TaxID=108571 RepID=A0ABR4PMQ4_9HELO